jgi:hypothetical protein
MSATTYSSFREFYPFYLSEHRNSICRRLHFVGTSLVIGIVFAAILHDNLSWLWFALLAGYGFAWVGHFVFEKNRPATFKHPLYSFCGDWVMWKDMLIGKIPF